MYNTDIKESSNENFGGETLDSGPLGTPASTSGEGMRKWG